MWATWLQATMTRDPTDRFPTTTKFALAVVVPYDAVAKGGTRRQSTNRESETHAREGVHNG